MEAKQQRLFELAQEMYQFRGGRLRPMYPFVLVWILPKVQKIGLILTPENQNKIMFEGIVIDIWRPFWQRRRDQYADSRPEVVRKEYEVYMESAFQPGDQILFPHWAGVPTDLGKTEGKEYRMIKEHTRYNPPDLAVGKWEFDQVAVEEALYGELVCEGIYPHHVPDVVKRLFEKYYVVPRLGQTARTISGV